MNPEFEKLAHTLLNNIEQLRQTVEAQPGAPTFILYGIGVAAVTAIASFVVAWVNNFWQRAKERRALHREKLEMALSELNALKTWASTQHKAAVVAKNPGSGEGAFVINEFLSEVLENVHVKGDSLYESFLTHVEIYGSLEKDELATFGKSFLKFKSEIMNRYTGGKMSDSIQQILDSFNDISNPLVKKIRDDIKAKYL